MVFFMLIEIFYILTNILNKINPLKIHKFKILNIDELNKQYIECCEYVIKFIYNI